MQGRMDGGALNAPRNKPRKSLTCWYNLSARIMCVLALSLLFNDTKVEMNIWSCREALGLFVLHLS